MSFVAHRARRFPARTVFSSRALLLSLGVASIVPVSPVLAGSRRVEAAASQDALVAPRVRTQAPAVAHREADPRARTASPAVSVKAGRTVVNGSRAPEAAPAIDLEALSLDIAATWIEKNPPQSMAWNWEEAVVGLGLQAVHSRTGDEAWLDYLQQWVDYHMRKGIRINRNDAVVPCTSALYLYDRLEDPVYLEPVAACEEYLAERAPRLEDGAIAHTLITPGQIWVDSLFMFGTFYTMDASLNHAAWAFDEVSEQFGLFRSHMVSSELGLYWHMYDEPLDMHIPVTPTFWGRGNGWALASLAMLLTDLPADHPDRERLEADFRAHADAVLAWQDPSGLWWTVLNRPGETYLETSASALFTFALLRGAHLGLLGDEALQAAQLGLTGLLSRIEYDENGAPVVTGNSRSTNPGPYWVYAHIPVADDEPYGVGGVLLAFQESLRGR